MGKMEGNQGHDDVSDSIQSTSKSAKSHLEIRLMKKLTSEIAL
jgi:hypothetical protein